MSTVSAGTKLKSDSGLEVIVVKAKPGSELTFGPGAGALLGKRYQCVTCQSEVLVTKVAPELPFCHGAEMALAASKQLPSSD